MAQNTGFLGERIKEIRRKSGLSQEEFAFRIDVSRQTVYFWESGKAIPDSGKLLLICKIFNVDANELLLNDIGNKEDDIGRARTADDSNNSDAKTIRGRLNRKKALRLTVFSVILLTGFLVLTAIGFYGYIVSARNLVRVSAVQLNVNEWATVIGSAGTIGATILFVFAVKTLIKTKKKTDVNAGNI